MAEESAEDRLAAALERIAKVVDSGGGAGRADSGVGAAIDARSVVASEAAARLDRIIATLRQALGEASNT